MVEKKIRLTRPYLPDGTLTELQDVLKSGYWTQGENVDRFEKKLAEYLGIDHVVIVSSGTAALHLALLTLDTGPGDEVIIPAFSFAATANVVKITGAKPVFVDIDSEDCCLNVDLLEKAITPQTKAIMPVHEFGAVADMDGILSIARKYNLKVIEDAACALGSEYKNQKAGTMGDLGCYSFHPRKIITTGEGGAIVTNNVAYADKLRMLRNHGSSGTASNEGFLLTGLNYRMTEFQAILGIEQLIEIEDTIKIRREQAALYTKKLAELKWLRTPRAVVEARHTYQSYHLVLEQRNRTELINFLGSRGIESNIGAQFLPGLASLKGLAYTESDFPVADHAYHQGMVLPIGRHLSRQEIETIISAIKEFGYGNE